jgi:hypothetical protein
MPRPNKSGIQWGRKVEIRNWRAAGLEMVALPDKVHFLVQASFDEKGVNEEASRVYLEVRETGNFYREVLGKKKQEVLAHYSEHGAAEF